MEEIKQGNTDVTGCEPMEGNKKQIIVLATTQHMYVEGKEGNVLFNNALNTLYLCQTYG